MNIEGELLIELHCQRGQVDRVAIRSSRPLQLTTLFEGKTVDELLTMVPMLYSVCSTAQAATAARACRRAMGLDAGARVELAETLLIDVETAREHLWRLLVDWPGYVDVPVNRPLVTSLSTLLTKAKSACFKDSDLFTLKPALEIKHEQFASVIEKIADTAEQAVFSMPPSDWYRLSTLDAFDRWLDQASTPSAQLLRRIRDDESGQLGDTGFYPLPAIDPGEMCRRLAGEGADQFIATPDWKGANFETSPLTRMASHPLQQQLGKRYGTGLMTRLASRLLELASLPGRLYEQLRELDGDQVRMAGVAATPGEQEGLGEVEAARGRLTHRAVVDQGIIAKYQILAPTEWNFHPRGVAARGLLSLPATDAALLQAHANLFINAIDPCVGYRLEVV